jgi:AcrR family transcriptional regulator
MASIAFDEGRFMSERIAPADVDLPPGMALAWGLTTQATRGPKRALTLDAVIDAGMAVATADGVTGMSMSKVAERLGVSTMALYRYVPSRDDLLELMVDAALGRPPAAAPDETWRDGLLRWATGVRDAYRANLWALRVPISAPPLGPNNMRWLEDALTCLRGTPLDMQQKLSTVLLVSGFVRSEEQLLHDIIAAAHTGRDANWVAQVTALIDPAEFPQVAAALASGAANDDDGLDNEFNFGVERVLDGIATLIAAERKRRRAASR